MNSPEKNIVGERSLVSEGEGEGAQLGVPQPAEHGHLAQRLVDPLQVLQH